MPDDDMGKGHLHEGGGSLTEEVWKHMAQQWNMSVEDAKKNVLEELKKQLGED